MKRIIDFHTHTFPDKIAADTVQNMSDMSRLTAYTTGSEGALLASMKEAGITNSVVLPVVTNPEKTESINNFSAKLNGINGIYHLGGMHPHTPDMKKEMARIPSLGLKGIKIHPVYQYTDIDDPKFLELLYCAGENGLFVVMHAGLDVGFPGEEQAAVSKTANALKQVGDVTLVLAHMGGWKQWEQVYQLADFKNTYIDTAFSYGAIHPTEPDYYTPEELPLMDSEQFIKTIKIFGANRVLFGTDSPWTSQKSSLEDFLSLPLSEEEKEKILYKNAERLLGE
ncbi:MAG: amidohydrolase family protein [Oscillospiraceae bacterium]|nr:amidohydrolase family protein [Oscillospiraceae bacterium]